MPRHSGDDRLRATSRDEREAEGGALLAVARRLTTTRSAMDRASSIGQIHCDEVLVFRRERGQAKRGGTLSGTSRGVEVHAPTTLVVAKRCTAKRLAELASVVDRGRVVGAIDGVVWPGSLIAGAAQRRRVCLPRGLPRG